jgi:hypothetical protein
MKYTAEMGYDIHTTFHEYWFRHSKVDRVGCTDIQMAR